jgi:hypothetical protein
VCVCISEKGRNKTQLEREKRLTERRKKPLAKLASKLKKTRQCLIPLAFGELASGYFHPCINSFAAGHLNRLNKNSQAKTTHDSQTQTISEQEDLVVLFIFTNYRK